MIQWGPFLFKLHSKSWEYVVMASMCPEALFFFFFRFSLLAAHLSGIPQRLYQSFPKSTTGYEPMTLTHAIPSKIYFGSWHSQLSIFQNGVCYTHHRLHTEDLRHRAYLLLLASSSHGKWGRQLWRQHTAFQWPAKAKQRAKWKWLHK